MLLGDDFLAYMILAIGGGLAVGNLFALFRPRTERKEGELVRPPIGRSALMIVLGTIASIWALATIVTT